MITKILEIVKKENSLIVKFDFNGHLRYTILGSKSLEYWAKRGFNNFEVGDIINVIENYDSKYNKVIYKIIGIEK